MVYTCGYWKDTKNLDEAQEAKLDLVCRKINLQKGMRVLDIGGGFGSFTMIQSLIIPIRGWESIFSQIPAFLQLNKSINLFRIFLFWKTYIILVLTMIKPQCIGLIISIMIGLS